MSASWVIREKATGRVICETFDARKVDALNTEKYEAVPIIQHLQQLNARAKSPPLKDEADAIRVAHADLIAAELAKWPEAEAIGERVNFDAASYLATLPKDAERRAPAAEKMAREHREQAEQDRARYEEIRREGLRALSDYDVVIAYGRDGVAAVRGSLRLKDAHITYHNSIASACEAEAAAAQRSIPQLELF